MIRPRLFRDLAPALRWSRAGGVALVLPEGDGEPCVCGSAQSSESSGYSLWWAGKFGVSFAEVVDRGTVRQRVKLTREQAAALSEHAAEQVGDVLPRTTVTFFTGTRKGMTQEQHEALVEYGYARDIVAAHHGLCIGADHEFHEFLMGLKDNGRTPFVTGWPARVAEELTMRGKDRCDDEKGVNEPLARNAAMALHAQWLRDSYAGDDSKPIVELIAMPAEASEPASGRGGTWHCIRKFRGVGVPVHVVGPNGRQR